VYKAICFEMDIDDSNPTSTAGYIHLLLFFVTGFERISNSAGKPIKRP
jgi:hypothetical protein